MIKFISVSFLILISFSFYKNMYVLFLSLKIFCLFFIDKVKQNFILFEKIESKKLKVYVNFFYFYSLFLFIPV